MLGYPKTEGEKIIHYEIKRCRNCPHFKFGNRCFFNNPRGIIFVLPFDKCVFDLKANGDVIKA